MLAAKPIVTTPFAVRALTMSSAADACDCVISLTIVWKVFTPPQSCQGLSIKVSNNVGARNERRATAKVQKHLAGIINAIMLHLWRT